MNQKAPINKFPKYEHDYKQKLHKVMDGSNHKIIPRNYYKEACELALIILSEKPGR